MEVKGGLLHGIPLQGTQLRAYAIGETQDDARLPADYERILLQVYAGR